MGYQFRNATVLIVESTRAMFDLTKGVLGAFGVGHVFYASDKESGFREFCKNNPDLIILDWLSDPDNGLALTKQIRNDPKSPNPFVPIIMMTGYSQKKRVVMARDSGITEFLVKPFTAKTLYNRIEQIVEKPRQFVKAPEYFGPERRRRADDYQGTERREERLAEMARNSKTPSRTAKTIRDKQE